MEGRELTLCDDIQLLNRDVYLMRSSDLEERCGARAETEELALSFGVDGRINLLDPFEELVQHTLLENFADLL